MTIQKKKPRVRWGALAALATTLVGVATDAHVVAAVKGAWPSLAASPYLILAGAVWQAATNRVVRPPHERAP
jgi:hypothetical protein